jgi:hypothetical protein
LFLLAAAAAAVSPVAALPLDDERRYDTPPTLPETITGVVRPGSGQKPARVDRIREVFQAFQACWIPGGVSGFTGQEITLRLAFKRSGEVLGQPRITYYAQGAEPDRREAFARSVREALERCSPLPFTPAFGAAVAGRPFTFRFSDTRPL